MGCLPKVLLRRRALIPHNVRLRYDEGGADRVRVAVRDPAEGGKVFLAHAAPAHEDAHGRAARAIPEMVSLCGVASRTVLLPERPQKVRPRTFQVRAPGRAVAAAVPPLHRLRNTH